MEHTPGPWRIRKYEPTEKAEDERWHIIKQNSGDWFDAVLLAEVHHSGLEWEEAEANAEFIVRSCNSHDALVEALKNVRRTIDAALLSKRINKQVHANIDSIIQKAISEVKDNDR